MNTVQEARRPGPVHAAQLVVDGFAAYQREHPVEGETPKYTLIGHLPGATVRGARLVMSLIIVVAIVIALLVVTSVFDNLAVLCVLLLVWIAGLWALARRTRRTPKAEWGRLIGVQLIGHRAIVMRQPQDGEAYELVAVPQ